MNNEQIGFFKKEKSTDWKWTMANDYQPKNGLKVFSCFACGGGSTMGYKLAGYEVLGCNEIDKKMNDVYVKNHNPKYNYLMDIRDFNKLDDLPKELFDLDILDGSPPCTTFSMAGERENGWGKEKKFREGQVLQTLDDLSFVFIDTVKKLQPKVVIMENVEGLLKGEAWGYVQKIYKQFKDIGYHCQHFLLKGENMGVPQTRHRVAFIANRIGKEQIDLAFDYEPIIYGYIKQGKGRVVTLDCQQLLKSAIPTDKDLSDIKQRLGQKASRFNEMLAWENKILPTITGSCAIYNAPKLCFISNEEIISASTFPTDFDFISNSSSNISYICGMSVPPIMIKRIATEIKKQWFDNTGNEEIMK